MGTPQGGNTVYNISHKSTKADSSSTSKETKEDEELEAEETEEEDETEEGDEESSEETEEEEEGKEGEEDSEQYIDLNKVPPQFREAAKRMLATHTKTQQKFKKILEEKELDLQEKYSEAVVKAAGFEKLTKLPGFKEFWEDVSNGSGYGYSSKFRTSGKTGDEEEDSSASGDKPVSAKSLMKELLPAINELIEKRVGPLREERANNLWADAEKNLPNFRKYKTGVTSTLTKYPNMSIQEAYDIVSAKDREEEAIKKALDDAVKTGKKIPRGTLKPGVSSGGKRDFDKRTIDTIDKALDLARHDLART